MFELGKKFQDNYNFNKWESTEPFLKFFQLTNMLHDCGVKLHSVYVSIFKSMIHSKVN
jgi:hypothetical protein